MPFSPLHRFGASDVFLPFFFLQLPPTVEAKINKSVPHESKIHTEKMFLLRSIFDVSGTICIRIFNLLLFRVPPYALMRVGRKGGGWCERNFVLRLVTRTHILGTKERESEWESE